MRIAFDLDGVLADLHTPFVEHRAKLFPELDESAMRRCRRRRVSDRQRRRGRGHSEAPTCRRSVRRPISRRQYERSGVISAGLTISGRA